ncbi:cobalamin biosynthesis protein CobD/CbiB [Pseudoalteromonas phenolica]|uniref:cobalamin biosynthesis protein CobD/CbiB n=1 Tax=Pseudoalteromonas phenolica TaxID=161398 RepID=UPI00110A7BA6|nr:cobalamin biosynthesis protein [Pseudoalteromonas phenolica]TMO56150.1 cobalamin biosynthesis protein [Pseudoalteromonas phenolica]
MVETQQFEAFQSLIIFICALAAAHVLPLLNSYNPITFFSLIFERIGVRVFKPKRSTSLQKIAGTLGFFLPIFTIVLIAVLISQFAFYPAWLGGLVLYFCLDTRVLQRAKRIAALLQQKQKATARQLLAQNVVREVNELSSIGIAKACIDSTALRTVRHYYLVIFFYLLLGPIAAFSFKLLLICDHAWRKRVPPNSAFIKPLQTAIFYIEFLPLRGFIFLLALFLQGKKTFHYFKHYARHCYQTNTGWILSLFAANLSIQLGGPCKYQGERFAKMRIGAERHPEPEDIKQCLTFLERIKWFTFSLIALIWLLDWFIDLYLNT